MERQEELRPYLFAIAYRMLGSVADAEDVVQEAFLRYHAAEVEPKAYLATITTRPCDDSAEGTSILSREWDLGVESSLTTEWRKSSRRRPACS